MAIAIHAHPDGTRSNSLRANRSVLLDCIRAVAILSVVVFHVATRYDASDLDSLAALARRYGLLGVDVFFPLSGFLITRYLIESTSSYRIQEFFVHRFLRIVPLYVVAVTVYLLLGIILSPAQNQIDLIWAVYLFMTGWFIFFLGADAVPFTITWSLSVEIFAYILFGFLAWISRRYLILFLVTISIAIIVFRYYLELGLYDGIYTFPLARIDSIAIGGIVAIFAHLRIRGLLAGLGGATLAVYAISVSNPVLWATLKYTFIASGTCFFIVLSETKLLSRFNGRTLYLFSSIGYYSYFTYLFHLFNIHFLLETLPRLFPSAAQVPFWPMVIASLTLTQFQAVISFRYFEGPIIRYGKRWRPSGRTAIAAPTQRTLMQSAPPSARDGYDTVTGETSPRYMHSTTGREQLR